MPSKNVEGNVIDNKKAVEKCQSCNYITGPNEKNTPHENEEVRT